MEQISCPSPNAGWPRDLRQTAGHLLTSLEHALVDTFALEPVICITAELYERSGGWYEVDNRLA